MNMHTLPQACKTNSTFENQSMQIHCFNRLIRKIKEYTNMGGKIIRKMSIFVHDNNLSILGIQNTLINSNKMNLWKTCT